jgi:hypothetical protein
MQLEGRHEEDEGLKVVTAPKKKKRNFPPYHLVSRWLLVFLILRPED